MYAYGCDREIYRSHIHSSTAKIQAFQHAIEIITPKCKPFFHLVKIRNRFVFIYRGNFAGNELLLSDLLGTDPDTVNREIETEAERQLLRRCIAKLDERERMIMEMRFGLNGKPEYTILGRHVEFSEDVPAFAKTVSEDTTVAFLFRFADYMLNTNMNVTVSKFTDNETDDECTKAIMLADGKVVDKNSYVPVVVKNS